jgi:hypothetical protein
LTGRAFETHVDAEGTALRARDIFSTFPVAVLEPAT